MIEPLILKLQRLGELSHDDRQMLENMPVDVRTAHANEDLMRENERPAFCLLVLDGMVCRYRLLQNDCRQIMSFHFPGDIVDLTTLLLGRMDHNVGALTPVRVAAIPHETLHGWTERHPRLARLLWQDTLVDAAVFREWVVNLGRRSPTARIAHLLCELMTRVRVARVMHEQTGDLPITSSALADATGLSVVHVARISQDLRARGLADLRDQVVSVLDWDGLQRVAGFDPGYLHQLAMPKAA